MSNFGIAVILGFRVVTNHAENRVSESISEIKTENLGFPRIGILALLLTTRKYARVVTNHAEKPNIGIGSEIKTEDLGSGDRAARVVTNHASPPNHGRSLGSAT